MLLEKHSLIFIIVCVPLTSDYHISPHNLRGGEMLLRAALLSMLVKANLADFKCCSVPKHTVPEQPS